MVSKKTEREIISALRRMRWMMPLTTALMAGMILPTSFAATNETAESSDAAQEVSTEDLSAIEAEVNEDSLRYLLLVDTFETAERIPSRRLDTPAEVVVITAAEIDANHYQSVREALSHVNGMVWSFINGSDRVLTLVDGHRTSLNPPIKMIDRIEIVKGGGSALYGSDAVGGVINIITKKGDHNETTVDINTGSWHRHRYEITNQGNDGKLGWFIDAAIGKSRPYSFRGSGDPDYREDYDNSQYAIRLDHRFDDRNSLTFHFDHDSTRARLKWSPHEYGLVNQLSLTYNFKEGTSTPGFLRYLNNYSHSDTQYMGKGNSRLQGVDYQNGWEMGQHRLIVGAEWHQSTDEHERWWNAEKKTTNQAYYIQDTITMGDKWTVVPGTRLDHNSQFGSKWSPKVAANYRPDDQTKIYASWGRVYQAPSAIQMYTRWHKYWYQDEIPYQYENWRGNPNLKPESGHTETIGIEHDFSDKINASFSLFNASISNFLDLNDYAFDYDNDHAPSDTRWPGKLHWVDLDYVNADRDKQHGLNLDYRQKIDDHWGYNLGYAYIHRTRPLGNEDYINHWRTPKSSWRAALRYQNGPWKASLMGTFGKGSNGSTYLEDDLALLDFNISCEVSDWTTIYVKAINFTNQNIHYYGRRWDAPGRLFQFGIDCRF